MVAAALLLLAGIGCTPVTHTSQTPESMFLPQNLIAWCIIPFDAAGRDPQQRAQMLNELGITRMAWDWRMEHIDQLEQEINTLREHNIELSAVWFWIDTDLEKGLLPHQEQILSTLKETGTQTTLWVSFPDNFFDDVEDQEKLERAIRNISIINNRAEQIGCKVALYNHMRWFGEPHNQMRIIETIGSDNLGIVYNFHHGQHHIDSFPQLLDKMMPRLWTINLNGMIKDGPKIVDIGKGEHEAGMIQTIIDSGYKGSIGIIGHTEGEDIEVVLRRNLQGLENILQN
jgi:sugar phosphate isomerase/epimerase